VTESRVERLLRKYRALTELRARREEAQAHGLTSFTGEEAAARRALFHTLAREFPGCLRELDSSSAARLRSRAEALERAPEPAWAEVVDAYHRALHDALELKRWLALRLPRGGEVTPSLVAEFSATPLAQHHPANAEHLARHLHPPGGRLQSLVWAELEARFARPRADLERDIFG
jgi:hypothetical protein